jgi:hypothetical protein
LQNQPFYRTLLRADKNLHSQANQPFYRTLLRADKNLIYENYVSIIYNKNMINILLVLLAVAVPLFADSHKKVLLQDVQTLTFYKGEKTKSRRLAPVPQLKCVGGTASDEQHYVDSVQCYNRGFDGVDFNWECVTQIPDRLALGKVEVVCEGFKDADDPYILAGSCALEYELNMADTKHKRVRLSDIGFLTFRDGMMTIGRNQKPQPQMQCIGGSANFYLPYSAEVSSNQANKLVKEIKCADLGDERNQDFKCIANLPKNYKLGWTEVVCEGYDYPDDPYVVEGSCYVRYYLNYESPDEYQSTISWTNMLWQFLIYITVMILGLYLFCWECFCRRSSNNVHPRPVPPAPAPQVRESRDLLPGHSTTRRRTAVLTTSYGEPSNLHSAAFSETFGSPINNSGDPTVTVVHSPTPVVSTSAAVATAATSSISGSNAGAGVAASSSASASTATQTQTARTGPSTNTATTATAATASAATAGTATASAAASTAATATAGTATASAAASTATTTTGAGTGANSGLASVSSNSCTSGLGSVVLTDQAVQTGNNVLSQNQATNVVINNIIVNHEPNATPRSNKSQDNDRESRSLREGKKVTTDEVSSENIGEKIEIKESVSYGKTRRR